MFNVGTDISTPSYLSKAATMNEQISQAEKRDFCQIDFKKNRQKGKVFSITFTQRIGKREKVFPLIFVKIIGQGTNVFPLMST